MADYRTLTCHVNHRMCAYDKLEMIGLVSVAWGLLWLAPTSRLTTAGSVLTDLIPPDALQMKNQKKVM